MKEKNTLRLTRTESYDAGYSRDDLLKKCALASAAALVCGSLTGCGFINPVSGDMEYDGYMAVESVSGSDMQSDPGTPSDSDAVSGADDWYQLDGDVVCTVDGSDDGAGQD